MRQQFLFHDQLQQLINILRDNGYSCIGPQVKDNAIIYDDLTHARQLPWGVRDHQRPGEYLLEQTNENQAFSWANGPQGLKPLLFKASETVWTVKKNATGHLEFIPEKLPQKPLAVFGVRACDIAGMLVQDKILINDKYVDTRYQQRRESLFIIAVNCTYSSNNCFCVSAGTGPEVKESYDLLMTELDNGFTISAGTARGEQILKNLPLTEASPQQQNESIHRVQQNAASQSKRIPLDNQRGLRDLLFSNLEHPRWKEVADRCLSCGNCTLVCPTCFCHTETDHPAIDDSESKHIKEWDSCFTAGHSDVGGHILRDDTRKRYRQWLTHKVGSWFDQFDTSGCIGCGRCITWCPVGIDITEELAAISGESNVKEPD